MDQRTVERFRQRVIWIHWLHMIAFVVLMVTGGLMFFHLTDFSSGHQIRIVHRTAAAFFVLTPVLFSLFDPRTTLSFLKDAFEWKQDDVLWLRHASRYYFLGHENTPPQGRINGDQKLWQLVVIVTAVVLTSTGIMLWLFKLKIPRLIYQGALLSHSAAFIVVSIAFMWHFYLRTLHPRFGESLSSMLDGRVSERYAALHYSKWYRTKMVPRK
jgi:formate dehydrogenase subunit gamma